MKTRLFRVSCLVSTVAMSAYALGAPLKISMRAMLG